ncbi:MAG TPA: 4a-hydroxytetrahydrobiopterin dehydratase [Vitreimonas sp.]|nr:4a-hydroxytetrahydrobiopterin dehydratase [Vitreimonas sp.]
MTQPITSSHHCVPCEGGTAPLTREEFAVYLDQVKEWEVRGEKQLQRTIVTKNFAAAVEFINQVAAIAEAEGHHPDLLLHAYKKVTVTLTTHAIGGLSINDFVMAVKIDELVATQ